jgi:hypothetical protein
MKLNKSLLNLITDTTTVANMVGINEISMEHNDVNSMFRGMDDSSGTPVVILQNIEEKLPFGSMAIRDTGSFISKLNLSHNNDENYSTFINIDDNTNAVKSIEFKGLKFKLSFIAGSKDCVKAPKRLKDEFKYSFELNQDNVKTLSDAIKAMKGEFVTFVCDGCEVSFEIRTGKTDVFSYTFCEEIMSFDGSEESFVFTYPVKSILNIIKNSDNQMFKLSSKGIFNTVIKNTNVFVFPNIS